MIEIKLGRSHRTALIDDGDFDLVSSQKWHAQASIMKNGSISTWYAYSTDLELMHRLILGVTERSVKVDHKNRNGLDNQRHNLRVATQSQNLANRPKSVNNTTGFKGVYVRKNGVIFSAISFNDKLRTLGNFQSLEDAARAYDAAAVEQWGEFAWTNFPAQAAVTTSSI